MFLFDTKIITRTTAEGAMAFKSFLLIFGVLAGSIHENHAYSVSKPHDVAKINYLKDANSTRYSFILLGATSDLSKRKIYPALWSLYRDNANKNVRVPEPYKRLILDVFKGSQLNFVRTDELREAWRIYEPTLWLTRQLMIRPKEYLFGSTGPKEADELERKYNFINQS